jgi:hypothetical protein
MGMVLKRRFEISGMIPTQNGNRANMRRHPAREPACRPACEQSQLKKAILVPPMLAALLNTDG